MYDVLKSASNIALCRRLKSTMLRPLHNDINNGRRGRERDRELVRERELPHRKKRKKEKE